MNDQNKNYEVWDDEIDFKNITKSLLNGKKWIIWFSLIFAAISIIYALFFTQPVYTSQSTVLIVANNTNQSRLSGLASQFGISLLPKNSSDEYLSIETIPEILSSRSLARKILSSKFTINKTDSISLFEILSEEIKEPDTPEELEALTISNFINKTITVKQLRDAPIFILFINSKDPQLSADIGSMTLIQLKELHSSYILSDLQEENEFVSNRLEEVRNKLTVAENKLKDFREQNLQITMSPSLLLNEDRLKRDIEVQTQVYISLKQQYEQIQIDKVKDTYNLKIIDEPSIPIVPSKPNRRLIVIVSTIFGFISGSVIALFKNINKV